jgi:hypothetical protein
MQQYPLRENEHVLWNGSSQRRQKWFHEHTGLVLLVLLFPLAVVLQMVLFKNSAMVPMYTGLLAAFFSVGYQRLVDRRSRARAMTYVVTNQRIIFAVNWPNGSEYRWIGLNWLPSEPRVRADESGVGTIVFGSSWSRWRSRENELRGAWVPPVLELFQIADAQRVAELIVNARAQLIAA